MQYRLSPGTRLSRGSCIAHQLFVIEEDGSEYLLAEEACSAPSGRCKTVPVTLDAGVADVKLCGEHSLAHELLQRQSEIDRGPSELQLELKSERHPAGVTFDASNKPEGAGGYRAFFVTPMGTDSVLESPSGPLLNGLRGVRGTGPGLQCIAK